MTVNFKFDSKDLAETYEKISNSQFNDGCILINQLEIQPGQAILDIGCGTGRLGRHVCIRIGSSGRYIGLDPLQERIKIAVEKNNCPNAVYQTGTAENLATIADNSIDTAYFNWVFHWVTDKTTALQEVFRVLKPEGKVGFILVVKDLIHKKSGTAVSNKILSREPYNKLVRLENSTQNQHGITTTEFNQLMTTVGFELLNLQIKPAKRTYSSTIDVMKFFEASFFGNFLNHVPSVLRDQAKADIAAEFEKNRTSEGIELCAYVFSAIIQKPNSLLDNTN